MKLEKTKKLQNVQKVFKSKLNQISRGRYESEDQKMVLKILNFFSNHENL